MYYNTSLDAAVHGPNAAVHYATDQPIPRFLSVIPNTILGSLPA